MGRKVTVVKEFMFEAAHFLLDYDGPCQRQHGHSYRLQIGVKGKIDKETGMVIDFSKLKHIVNTYIIQYLDHFLLNEIVYMNFPSANPTAENMVVWILEQLQYNGLKVKFVRLWETTTSFAEVKA